MANFGELLSRVSGEAKKPPVLPEGTYPGVIKSYEPGESGLKKTPYVRFHVQLTGWADDAEPLSEVDPTKRAMRRDFFITDEALWRFDDFLRSCNVGLGRSYDEVLPDLIGMAVLAKVKQGMNTKTNELFNEIDTLVGA